MQREEVKERWNLSGIYSKDTEKETEGVKNLLLEFENLRNILNHSSNDDIKKHLKS